MAWWNQWLIMNMPKSKFMTWYRSIMRLEVDSIIHIRPYCFQRTYEDVSQGQLRELRGLTYWR